MATHSFKAGQISIDLLTKVKVSVDPEQLVEPPGGLYPLRAAAFELDEYRMMAGWPVPVPAYDIRAKTLVSATGEVLTGREDPLAITTGAAVRWVADDEYYNTTNLTWVPVQNGLDLLWKTTTDYTPTFVSDYNYRVEDERFYRNVINFDSDTRDHFWCDMGRVLGGASGYTVLMVVSLNSLYGNNNVDVPYNGLWCPGGATGEGDTFIEDPGTNWVSVTVQGRQLFFETESNTRAEVLPVGQSMGSNAPFYIAMCFGRPESHFYVGPGASNLTVKTMPTGSYEVPLNDSVVLGRTTGDVLHTADMALFDLGIYTSPLSAAEVRDEIAKLSQSYGGDS